MPFQSPFQGRISGARERVAELRRRMTEAGEGDVLDGAMDERVSALEALDVSDAEPRARAEGLATSQPRHAGLFHHAPGPCPVAGPDATIRERSGAAREPLGALERTLAGKPVPGFVAAGERRAFRDRVNRAAAPSIPPRAPLPAGSRSGGCGAA